MVQVLDSPPAVAANRDIKNNSVKSNPATSYLSADKLSAEWQKIKIIVDDIKVICATNRPDVLDPALMRSGRLDRKIEFPVPNEDARVQILKIHSRKMRH